MRELKQHQPSMTINEQVENLKALGQKSLFFQKTVIFYIGTVPKTNKTVKIFN